MNPRAALANGQPRVCEKCDKPMMLVISDNKPEASEWYCAKDHYSVLTSGSAPVNEFREKLGRFAKVIED